jgi:hypothetical protein
MQVGQSLNDPRSTGQGLTLLSWIAVGSGSYAEALEYSEQALSVAITENEQISASGAKAAALVLLGRIEEGAILLEEFRRRCDADGHIHSIGHGTRLCQLGLVSPHAAQFRFRDWREQLGKSQASSACPDRAS